MIKSIELNDINSEGCGTKYIVGSMYFFSDEREGSTIYSIERGWYNGDNLGFWVNIAQGKSKVFVPYRSVVQIIFK